MALVRWITFWMLYSTVLGARNGPPGFKRCPTLCVCEVVNQGKRVICDLGGLTEIPTAEMDKDIRVLIVTAPPDHPNELTIGRIFLQFTNLEEVRITFSSVPAIGDSSFWPGKRLQILDLSNNNISILKDSDFNGLTELRVLNLSHNSIAAAPSAPFRFLNNLTSLILSNNQLQALVPRFFYLLPRLQRLDLSGNPLKDIDPENLKDVRPLRVLNLARCQLKRLHSLIYQQLSNLEILNLQDNQFTHFAPEEFRHLRKLRLLYLDGNRLSVLSEKTFDGHTLSHLGLSRNRLTTIAACAFCNTSIEELDLSRNRLSNGDEQVFRGLAHSLNRLDLSWNPLSGKTLAKLIKHLSKLTVLRLEGLGLSDLPADTFEGVKSLRILILSNNHFANFFPSTFSNLRHLELLDLSFNRFNGMHQLLLDQLDQLTALSRLALHHNPWICVECHIAPLVRWLQNHPMDCGPFPCPQCQSPTTLAGRDLASLVVDQLELCNDPVLQPRVSPTKSQVGFIVAIIIIMVLVTIIIATIIVYRRQGAVYYTHEDERGSQTYDNPGLKDINGSYENKRPSIITSIEKMEEKTESQSARGSVG